MNTASKPCFKYRFDRLVKYYINEVKRLDIDVRLNTLADEEYIESLKPDAIIMATGSKELLTKIPGAEHCLSADDVLNEKVEVGEKRL